jgi:glycosyltransferase involved in cell wall biosynthesis
LSSKKTVAIIITTPLAIKFFLKFIIAEFEKKYSVIIMTDTSLDFGIMNTFSNNIKIIDIKIKRKINVIYDLRTFFILLKHFNRENISVVYCVTPKAGLVGIVASKIMKIPVRIHNFTGQVWKTKKGIYKYILKKIDKIIYLFSTKVIVDSESQRRFLLNEGIIKMKKSIVIGNGSISGVDIDLFAPNHNIREEIRKKIGVKSEEIVFIFVGRLNIDKGIVELIKAYSILASKVNNTSLWFVGPNETGINDLNHFCEEQHRESIYFIPYTLFPEKYMISADVFCLPSYREGFGSTIIESASCGIPSIGSKIYGLTDAIIDGRTGYLFEVGNVESLANKMITLATNKSLRIRLGSSAKTRVHKFFDQRLVVQNLIDFIDEELSIFYNS